MLFIGILDTSLRVEGGAGIAGPGSASAPMVGGLAVLHNAGPWPVSVTSITSPTAEPGYSLTRIPEGGGTIVPGAMIEPGDAVQLAPGESMYLSLALAPDGETPAAVRSIDVHYSALFGLQFSEHSTAMTLLVYPSDMPVGVASIEGDEKSVLLYVGAVRDALRSHDLGMLASIMGNGATFDDAEAFWQTQVGVTDALAYSAAEEGKVWSASFLIIDSANSLPPFYVEWADYRWSVVR